MRPIPFLNCIDFGYYYTADESRTCRYAYMISISFKVRPFQVAPCNSVNESSLILCKNIYPTPGNVPYLTVLLLFWCPNLKVTRTHCTGRANGKIRKVPAEINAKYVHTCSYISVFELRKKNFKKKDFRFSIWVSIFMLMFVVVSV